MVDKEELSKDKIKSYSIERDFLAGLLKFPETIFEVENFISEGDFCSPVASKLYSVIRHLLIDKSVARPDSAIILATISNMTITFPAECKITDYIGNLYKFGEKIEYKNVPLLAKEIILLSRRRDMWECGNKIQRNMLDGHSFGNIQEIISVSDEIYFDAVNKFVVDDDMLDISTGVAEDLHKRADNPVERVGFSSGFDRWDRMIGYLRPDTLSFISARAKVGKSMIGLNIARHVAQNERIKVMYMDSEMSQIEMRDRLVAHIAQTDIGLIETGHWRGNKEVCDKVTKAIALVQSLDISYLSIRSLNINSILSGCRRFLFKKVKRNFKQDKFNECLIIYDYLKLDYSSNPGDNWHLNLAKSVVNFKDLLGKTGATGLLLGQQNRSGITKFDHKNNRSITQDDESIIAGTDEVLKSSSNVSSLRFKTAEEIAADGEKHGNVALIPFVARNGRGGEWCMLSEGVFCRDYVNMHREPAQMTFKEVSTKSEILASQDISHALHDKK